MRFVKILALSCCLSISLLAAGTSSAIAQPDPGQDRQEPVFIPNIEPELTIPRVSGDVEADGRLTEAIWRSAAVATGFSESFPDEQAKPPIGIKALMAYDAENLYVAYIIEDDPEKIRVNLSDRDQIWQDDYAGFMLDTNGDGQVTYFISANPLGIQGDTRSGNGDEDMSFDLVYYSGGKVTNTGYQVELVIPFRSLRFPAGDVHEWRLTHWITHPRESRNQYTWAAIDRDDPCMSCQFGTIKGLTGIRSGRNLEILPTLTGSQSSSIRDRNEPSRGLDADRATAEPSLNVKYGITSNLTADVTINPDFSQIESDAAQIDVNETFALSFPERRAFFQEGADLFRTDMDVVYTRSINDPSAAAKLSGRFGDWTVGYIGARDEKSPILLPFEESSLLVSGGQSVSNILRARRSFENNSFLAGTITDRRLDAGGVGSTIGADASLRFWTRYRFNWQLVSSYTNESTLSPEEEISPERTFDRGAHTAALDGETFWGHAVSMNLGRNGRHYGFDIDYSQISPTFRAANGFIRQNDSRRVELNNRYTFWPDRNPFLDRLTVFGGASRVWNFDNVRKDEFAYVGFNTQLTGQTNVQVNGYTSNELFQGVQFSKLWGTFFRVNSDFSEKVGGGFGGNLGTQIFRSETPEVGNQFSFFGRMNVRPTDRLKVQPSINYSRLRDRATGHNFFSGYILRSRVNYQFTRKFKSRVIVQYNDFSQSLEVDPLITYRVNAFTVIHVGSTHRYDTLDISSANNEGNDPNSVLAQTNRQVFFKLQYLFRQ